MPASDFLTKSRGRPIQIQIAVLASRRDRLYALLDKHWLEIRSLLRKVKSPEDVPNLFRSVPAEEAEVVNVFVRTIDKRFALPSNIDGQKRSPFPSDGTKETREHISILRREMRSISQNNDLCFDRLSRITATLQSQMSDDQRKRADIEHGRLQSYFDREKSKLRDVQLELNDRYAFLARSELVQFVRSNRYTLNPLHAANALAGLPEIGWRQSSIRCRNIQPPSGTPLYKQYEAVKQIIRSRGRERNLVQHAEHWLRTTPPSKCEPVKSLRKKWYYLKRAIEDVVDAKTQPRDLATSIIEQFRHRQADASLVDRLLEEDEQITRKRPKIEL